MASKDIGPGKEFFSDWHKERFIEDTQRDAEAQASKVAELEAAGLDASEAKERLANAQKQLNRFKPKAKAK